jgi:phage tail sheath protein FI
VIQTETFRNLSMDPRHNQYFQTLIGAINGPLRLSDNRPEGTSWLIRTQDNASTQAALQAPRLGPEALIDILSSGLQRPAQHNLENGDDGISTITDQTYIGVDNNDPRSRTGIFSLLNVPQISIVAVPGQGSPAIQSALISHCENALYRFAVLDPEYADSAIAEVQAQRQLFDTKFAAIYYPWLTIEDPYPTNLSNILDFQLPPSGHIAGIYARVDDARGVFKAPANEVVQGITGLTATLAKGDQDVLNPSPTNINVIRDFRQSGRGLRVWGARVMTSDANYTYVPVKRLMMFIEESLDVGLQGIVFEPNAPPLWARLERMVANFLTTVWAAGGLQGDKAEDSFFVRCDLTTMTQTDIEEGRLIAQVGVAPVYPAEFVIIQISLTIPATSN